MFLVMILVILPFHPGCPGNQSAP